MSDQSAPSHRPFATPVEAADELERLYSTATKALRASLDDFRDGRVSPSEQTPPAVPLSRTARVVFAKRRPAFQ